VGVLHLVFATIFFVVLAVFSLVLFTKTRPGAMPTGRKRTRNAVYRVCGVVILLCLVLAAVTGLVLAPEVKDALRPLFWLEAIAVFAFGVSWTVKGWNLFPDLPAPAGRAAHPESDVRV
jgi:hypothetical protein